MIRKKIQLNGAEESFRESKLQSPHRQQSQESVSSPASDGHNENEKTSSNNTTRATPGSEPRTATAQWHLSQERGSLVGMRIIAWLYRRVGWRVAHLLLYPVVTYFLLTDREGRRASIEYLRRVSAAGSAGIPEEPSLRHVFLHYMEFGITILDRVGFWLARTEDFDLSIKGGKHLNWIVEQGRGAVILGSHLGSFDAMRLIASQKSPIDIKLLMYTQHAARINRLLHQTGEISGAGPTIGVIQSIPGSFAHTFEVKQAIARGEAVAILADRIHPNERGREVEVEFLGDRARLPQGPLLLAATLGCPVLIMTGIRTGSRKYEIHVERFADAIAIPRNDRPKQLQHYAQAYADSIANLCVLAPLQWFNFYDFWARSPQTLPSPDDDSGGQAQTAPPQKKSINR